MVEAVKLAFSALSNFSLNTFMPNLLSLTSSTLHENKYLELLDYVNYFFFKKTLIIEKTYKAANGIKKSLKEKSIFQS